MNKVSIILCRDDFKDVRQWVKLMYKLNWPESTKCVEMSVVDSSSALSKDGEALRTG